MRMLLVGKDAHHLMFTHHHQPRCVHKLGIPHVGTHAYAVECKVLGDTHVRRFFLLFFGPTPSTSSARILSHASFLSASLTHVVASPFSAKTMYMYVTPKRVLLHSLWPQATHHCDLSVQRNKHFVDVSRPYTYAVLLVLFLPQVNFGCSAHVERAPIQPCHSHWAVRLGAWMSVRRMTYPFYQRCANKDVAASVYRSYTRASQSLTAQ